MPLLSRCWSTVLLKCFNPDWLTMAYISPIYLSSDIILCGLKKSGVLVSLFSSPSLWQKEVLKLFSTGCRRVFSRGLREQSGCGEGREELARSGTWGRRSHNWRYGASQRYLEAAEDLRCCSWCFEQIFEDSESFLLRRKCAISASVEIILFWAWLIIFNYFEFRHQQSIVYTW